MPIATTHGETFVGYGQCQTQDVQYFVEWVGRNGIRLSIASVGRNSQQEPNPRNLLPPDKMARRPTAR